ncbi:MAG: SUMF1/EgtB/PvdO family nonheme iron enzyme [Pseudomonadota bacterium]
MRSVGCAWTALASLVFCLGAAANPALVPPWVEIAAGDFIQGSDRTERDIAYILDQSVYGHTITREQSWYESEFPRTTQHLPRYWITRNLVTNRQYARFVKATGHRAPGVDPATWASYGLIHPYARARKFIWDGAQPPRGREDHPVVLVSRADAEAYATWLSRETDLRWELPSEAQWEKAARGVDGRYFPWGNAFEAHRLNSHDRGPFDTTVAGAMAAGESPFGMRDAAGQVFEWTRTAMNNKRTYVKGGSWDDKGCGVCRPAARHTRPNHLKHILIGFRLVTEQRPTSR